MPTISHASPLVTTINVFCVAPEDQQQAFQALTALARRLLASVPGLLSASFHLSTESCAYLYTGVRPIRIEKHFQVFVLIHVFMTCSVQSRLPNNLSFQDRLSLLAGSSAATPSIPRR